MNVDAKKKEAITFVIASFLSLYACVLNTSQLLKVLRVFSFHHDSFESFGVIHC
jgi:hypothetical protein